MTHRTPIQIARDLKASVPSPETDIVRQLAEALLDATDELERLQRILAPGPRLDPSLEGRVAHVSRVPVDVEEHGDVKYAKVFGYGEQGQYAVLAMAQKRSEQEFYAELGRHVFRAAQGLPILYARTEVPTHEA